MEPVGGPVIEEDTSRRSLARIALVVMGVAVLVGGVVLLRGGGDDGGGDVAADRVGESLTDEAPSEGDTPAESPAATDEGAVTTAPPATAPAGEPDLLHGDSSQAFGAFTNLFGGEPVKVLEIVVYADWAYIDVQVPSEPTHVDEYTWRGGDGASGPEPQQLLDMEIEELPDKLFDLSEIDPSKLPSMSEQALAQFPQAGMEVTHIIIDRFLPFDTRVLARVYVDNERGEGGYVEFTPDGGLVEVV